MSYCSRLRKLLAVIGALAAMLTGADLHAATITMEAPHAKTVLPLTPLPTLQNPTIRLTGMIEVGDTEKLRAMLVRVKTQTAPGSTLPLATLELSSLGGSLLEGVQIGELLKRFGVVAVVRGQDLCLSACALALLGGNAYRKDPVYPADCNVEPGGRVAFHNFFLGRNGLRENTQIDPVASRLQGFADARGGAALLVRYAAGLGLPPSFVAGLLSRPPEELQYVETIGQFIGLNICPTGLGRPTEPIDRQAINICNNALGSTLPPSTYTATAIPAEQARQYLLERVQESMHSAKARGRLADQLASWQVMRVRDEIDKLYADLRAAGLALPEIVGPTFEIGFDRGGVYKPACYVSLSTSNPDSYDVVVQGTRGLADAPREPRDNARRLFLFDAPDVVNPPRGRKAGSSPPPDVKTGDPAPSPVTSGRALPPEGDRAAPRSR